MPRFGIRESTIFERSAGIEGDSEEGLSACNGALPSGENACAAREVPAIFARHSIDTIRGYGTVG